MPSDDGAQLKLFALFTLLGRNSWLFLVQITLGALAVGACGGTVTPVSDEAPRRTLVQFFEALRDERHEDAYELLATSLTSEMTVQTFSARYIEAQADGRGLESFTVTSTPQVTSRSAVFTVDLAFADGQKRTGEVAVVREGSRWAVVLPPE